MDNYDVLVIGRACVDHIAVVEEFPQENQKKPLSFKLKEGGGQGSTAACCISRLGGRVAYVGHVGDDINGRFCIDRMRQFGVQTDHVAVVPKGKTPVAYVFVTKSSGARTIVYEKNALPKIDFNRQLEELASFSKVVLLDPEVTYLGRALKTAADRGFKVVYDCERWREGMQGMMSVADYYIPSADYFDSPELNLPPGSLVQKMHHLKQRISGVLIATNGEDGAYCCQNQSILHVAVPEVDAIDTIGAGDNFHAAFSLAISRGSDTTQAVKYAVAVASLSCRDYGSRTGVPHHDEAAEVARMLQVNTTATSSL